MTLTKEAQKEYAKQHYLNNKSDYYYKSNFRRRVLKKIINDLKHMEPCSDCYVRYPYWVMQFDHRPGEHKKFQVSDVHLIGSVRLLLEEIDKCDLVCSNCHFDRTYRRSYPDSLFLV